MKNELVYLLGYMGAGKTTVGKRLAERLGWEFRDLDWMIEDRGGMAVKDIFAERGEDGFRNLERDMLRETAAMKNVVVAVGGGTPCFFDNMDFMKRNGRTVYLNASVETLMEHIHITMKDKPSGRPLLEGMDDEDMSRFISRNLAEREPYYTKADVVFDIPTMRTEKDIDDVSEKIASLL